MADAPLPPKLKPRFFDLDPQASQEYYRPASLMRTTEWGGLTILSLLASFFFPPYFLTVLTIAFLNAGGLLWVTHLSEKGRKRLIEFEAEFRKGFEKEESGFFAQAVEHYASMVPKYQDYPRIAEIALKRMDWLKKEHPQAFQVAAPLRKAHRRSKKSPKKAAKS